MNDEALHNARRLVGWPEALIITATLLELAVALVAHHFPYSDVTNHLARFSLISRIWSGDAPGYVVMHWLPTSYIAGDLVGTVLVRLVGAAWTLRLIDAATLILLPFGMYRLLLHTAPAQRGWALVGVLFGFETYFIVGYMNYALGLALLFCWLAAWYPRRAQSSWRVRVALALGAGLLFLVHLSAPLIALVVIWTDWGIAVVGDDRLLPPRQWRLARPELVTVVAVSTVVIGLWIGASYSSWQDTGPKGDFVIRTFANKIIVFLSPFYSLSVHAGVIMALGYAASLIALLFVRRAAFKVDSLVASGVLLFVLYLIFPKSIPGAGEVDFRWLPAAYLLLFCGRYQGSHPSPRRAYLVPFVACLLLTGSVAWTARDIDRDLDQLDAALEHVPPNTVLLPLGEGARKYGRVAPRFQYAFWHTIREHGREPGLFNFRDFDDSLPLNYHLAHFTEARHLYNPVAEWGDRDHMTSLPWDRIDAEYDYILQMVPERNVSEYLRANATEVWRDSAFAVFKVRRR